ncbi:hypothetical protein ACSBR2_040296 [Camellia fascicularis]
MAESAVTFLLRKLGSLIEEELKSLGRVKGEIVFIRDELQSMSAFLRVADAIEDTDPEIQAWVKQVRDVALDTDDVLDEFMLRFARHHHHHHRGFYGSVCKIYYQINNMKARRQIASDIQDIKARVIHIAERRQRYEAWDAIKIALPNRNCGSRVLLTTRIGNVASISCRESHGYIYEMKALSPKESWTLFCKKTFQEKDCPPHLIEISKSVLRRCEGLPLAIVVISGVLASKDHGRVDEWELVNRSLGAEVEGSDMKKILLLSYNDLPYYLKSCLLYLSSFPEDHLIEWKSSIRLWIAEGFVEVKEFGKTLEEVAEAYLYELLNRNLIQVARRKFQRLKYLGLNSLKELRWLTMEEGTMSRLEELIIMDWEFAQRGEDLLRKDWKSNAGCLPQLVPDQTLKLKQLTVLTLAETDKKVYIRLEHFVHYLDANATH